MAGVSSGIGLACAKKILELNFEVLGISRTKPVIDHPNLEWVACDLSSKKAIDELCKTHLKNKNVDGLIYCAGVGHFGALEQLSANDFSKDMQLNCLSAMQMTKAILPAMKKNQAGFCVYLGSEAALKGAKQGGLYCATKFALRGFTQSLAEEVRSDHIRVTLINPGLVKTNFHNEASFEPSAEKGCSIDLDLIADQIVSLVQQKELGFISEITIKPYKNIIAKK